MWIKSSVLAELIEPTLFSLRQPTQSMLAPLVERARKRVAEETVALGRDHSAVDRHSYELGIATTFVELLSTAEQRSELGDALRVVSGLEWAQRLLHELALIEKHGAPIRQQALAQQLGVDGGNLSRRIQRLIALNLIERNVAGAGGARFSLTALGRDALDELIPGWQATDPATEQLFESEEVAVGATSSLLDKHLNDLRNARMKELPPLIDEAIKGITRPAMLTHDGEPFTYFVVPKAGHISGSSRFWRSGGVDEVATIECDVVIDSPREEVAVQV